MDDDLNAFWMRRALAEATRGRGAVEPNPMVGAVVVKEGQIVGIGHHEQFGGPHAEVFALRQAGDNAHGATLYVTLEPCAHEGKTPPCTKAIIASGVNRVAAAMRDPFLKVAGQGFQQLRDAGIDVSAGLLGDEAKRLNAPYLKRLTLGRPFVTAKWAMTLDGRIATATGHSQWISSERSRAIVHEIRGRMDAIVIGIGTALVDNPSLTARPPGPKKAARVVLDSAANLPPTSALVVTARETPTIVAVTQRATAERIGALTAAGCEVLRFDEERNVPIKQLLNDLATRRMTNVLVEGGGRVLGAFLDADEIDAVEVFIAPIIEGGPSRHVPFDGHGMATMDLAARLDRHEISVIDGDIWLRGEFCHEWLDEGGA